MACVAPAYLNPRTGETYPLDQPIWRAPDGGPVRITPLAGIGRGAVDLGSRSLWRYRAALPVRVAEVVGDIASSGGGAVTLTEEQIAAATLDLAATGIYVEPTCAQAAAAYGMLLCDGRIGPADTTVLVLTETGLKATPRPADLLGVPL